MKSLFAGLITSLLVTGFSHTSQAQLENQFFGAILGGDLAAVEALLASGVDVNLRSDWDRANRRHDGINQHHSYTVLMIAAEKGDSDITLALVEAGADLNAVDHDGNTALTYGVRFPDVVKVLVDGGADVNFHQNSHGVTPLMFAAGYGHPDSTLALIDAGADLNATDYMGKTALMFVASNRNYPEDDLAQVVVELIAAGADLNVSDHKGNTALTIASKSGYQKIASMILKALSSPLFLVE